MKKIFKSLALIFMLVPLAMITVACSDEEPYDKEANVQAYNNAVEILENSLILNNYTQTTTIELSETLLALLESDGESFETPTTTVYYDDGNIHLVMEESSEVFMVGDKYIEREYDTDNNVWGTYSTTNSAVTGMFTNTLSSMDFDFLQEIAFKLNSEAITTTTNNGVTTVSVKIDLGSLFNKLLANIKVNQNRPVINVLNQLIADLYSADVTIDSLVAAMKTNITEETTINDVLDMIATETGYDVKTGINSMLNSTEEMMLNMTYSKILRSSSIDDNIDFGTLSVGGEMTEMFDMVNMMLETPVFAIMEVDEETFGDTLDTFLASLKDENNTITNVLAKLMLKYDETETMTIEDAQETIEMMYMLMDMVSIRDLSVTLNITTADETLQGYSLDLGVDVGFVGMPERTQLSASINSVFSEIGSTVVEIPQGIEINDAIYTIEIDSEEISSLLDGEDLVIENVEFEYLKTFTTTSGSINLVVYNETAKTLTISNQVITSFLEEIDADADTNLISIEAVINGVNVNLEILLIESE